VPESVAGHYCPRHGGRAGGGPDPEFAATVANLAALPADELTAYRVELGAAPPDDPHLEFDRAALAAADRLRREGA